VEVWADGGIYLDAPMTAGDRIKLGTCGDLTTTANGPLTAGGDIELDAKRVLSLGADVTAEDDIEIWANGGIIVNGAMTAGDRIELATCGDLMTTANGLLTAGGDIELYAKGAITVGADLVAGDDVWMKTDCGDVLIKASVQAGDRIEVLAGKKLIISAPLQAGGDLNLYAKDSLKTINKFATITAGMDVVLGTCKGDIELVGAVTAGAGWAPCSSKHCCHWHKERPDVEINAGGAFRLYGTVTSQDDVNVFAWGDIEVIGTIAAGDEIRLSSWDDIDLLPGSLLTGISGKKAQRVSLFARDQVILQGAINAEKLVVIPKARCSMLFPGEAGCFRC
jgi:hypothetical protein